MKTLLVVAWLGIVGASAGCGDADRNSLTAARHDLGSSGATNDTPVSAPDPSGTTSTSSDGTSPAPTSTTTTAPTTTTTTPPPPPATDVFSAAPAFVSQVAGSTHNAGQNCMGGCHNHGFTFAGTLTDAAGAAIAGAEVRLVDANGQAISVYTGANGNFHSSTAFAATAKVGVRNATTKALMATGLTLANGGCNGCHATGGTQTPIHLP